MASTYSANLKIELIATGEQSGTWGGTTNTNLGTALEESIVGYGNPDFASDADLTLSLTDSNATQVARNLVLNVTSTGALTATRNLVVPTIEKPYVVQNNTSGGQSIVVKTSGGTGITVPNGKSMFLYTDGTNVVEVTTHTPVSSGGTGAYTLTANNVLLGNGTDAVQFVAPGSSGNVLTSNGSTWTSAAAAAFDSGTVMLFGQTSAPTGWTKDTTNYNNSGLRVVTGTASTGGSVDFTTAFASQTPSGTVSVSGSAGATTLSTPQIPSHSHYTNLLSKGQGTPPFTNTHDVSSPGVSGLNTASTGGGGSHSHPFSVSSSTFSGNAINLAVKYVDVIRASKD